jgi:predicted phosphodiesterase
VRFAAIADIHGNAMALEAVLADIARLGITDVVNLGDHLSGPLEAARTADILIARHFTAIAGNHDRYLIDHAPEAMGLSDRAAFVQLRPNHVDWLRTLPATRVVFGDVFMCHGTPTSDETYWMEQVTPDGVVRIASQDEIERQAVGIGSALILCAHTHTPRVVRLRNDRLLVNPGSVGCPAYTDKTPVPHAMETGSPDARYAVLEKLAGRWTVMFRSVFYDHMAASRLAQGAQRQDWAQWLATGRAT